MPTDRWTFEFEGAIPVDESAYRVIPDKPIRRQRIPRSLMLHRSG